MLLQHRLKPPNCAVARFGDFDIHCISRVELVNLALSDCRSAAQPARLVFDANGHALSLAKTDSAYRSNIKQADIIHADGAFLVTLSRLFDLPQIPERSATTDMIHDFSSAFSGTPFSFFLLGGEEHVNARCVDILQSTYGGLNIAGRRNGFFTTDEEAAVVEHINETAADILWVGLGKPKEQDFCVRWRDKLRVRWAITCGGCFNFVTGHYTRAPSWIQRANMEWLHRMATNPRKLFWRYLVTTPHAMWIAIRDHSSAHAFSVTSHP